MRSLFISAALFPLFGIFSYLDTFGLTAGKLLEPLMYDLRARWATWLVIDWALDILMEQKRLHLLPIYLVCLAQVQSLLFESYLTNEPLLFHAASLLTISVCSLISWLFPVPSLKNKTGLYILSYLDSEWSSIRSHDRQGVSMIPVRIYYPSTETKNSIKATYKMRENSGGLLRSLFGFFSIFISYAALQTISILPKRRRGKQQALPLDDKQYQYPVIIVSQDYNGVNANPVHLLCEKLCQYGNVIVSVKHTNVGCPTLNPFGLAQPSITTSSKTPRDPSSADTHDDAREVYMKQIGDRMDSHVFELSFVIDRLLAIQYGQSASMFGKEDEDEGVESHLFKGRLDLERVILLGHSFSGATVLKHACEDRRIRAVVGIDAWVHPLKVDLVEAGASCPLLLLQSGKTFFASDNEDIGSNNDEYARKIVSNTNTAYLYRMTKSGHYDILDLVSYAPRLMRTLGLSGMQSFRKTKDDDLVTLNYQEVISTFVREFMEKHVNENQNMTGNKENNDDEKCLSPQSKRKAVSNGFMRSMREPFQKMRPAIRYPLLDEGKLYEGVVLEKKGWQ